MIFKRKPPEPSSEVACAQCGKLMSVRPSRIAKSASGLVFCSNVCSSQYQAAKLAVNATCNYCSRSFRRAPSELSKHPDHKTYCSRECYERARDEGIANKRRPVGRWGKHETICPNCGTAFYVKPSIFKTRQQLYCSRKCKGEAMRTSRSYSSRLEMRKKFDKCQVCGLHEPEILEVHHIDGRHGNNKPDNLLMVCPNCHTRLHKKLISLRTKNG